MLLSNHNAPRLVGRFDFGQRDLRSHSEELGDNSALRDRWDINGRYRIYSRLTEVFHDVFDDDSIELTPQLSAKDVDLTDSLALSG